MPVPASSMQFFNPTGLFDNRDKLNPTRLVILLVGSQSGQQSAYSDSHRCILGQGREPFSR